MPLRGEAGVCSSGRKGRGMFPREELGCAPQGGEELSVSLGAGIRVSPFGGGTGVCPPLGEGMGWVPL